MNKEFFRGMKEQIEPDEEQVEELKNKLKNTAAVSRKPMWIGGRYAQYKQQYGWKYAHNRQ